MDKQKHKQAAIRLGHYVKRIRNARGFSVRQLEIQSGVDNAYISMIENHTRNGLPKISTINKLAKGLDVSPIHMYKIVGVKYAVSRNKIDLARALKSPINVEWNGHPLDHDDILAMQLWFKHRRKE